MSHFQQVYTAQPSPAVMMNSPQPYNYNYPQHPSMQSYYPSVQPMQQPSGFMHQNNGLGGSGCLECCFALLCIGACTYCCTQGCCPDDGGCCCGGGYNDPNDCGCC